MGAYTGKKLAQLESGEERYIGINCYPVSKEKFVKLCNEKGITFMSISRAIGYASNSVTSALQVGYMTQVMIAGIENIMGIKYEEFAYVPSEKPKEAPETKPEETPVQQNGISEESLYTTIKTAVTDAVNEAIAGNLKNLRGMIYTAIYTAINAAKKEA